MKKRKNSTGIMSLMLLLVFGTACGKADTVDSEKGTVQESIESVTQEAEGAVGQVENANDGQNSIEEREELPGTGEVSESTENTGEADVIIDGDHRIEKVHWEDLDGNGVEEYLMIENDTAYGRITMYVNEEPVYQYEEELSIVGVGSKEYADLDHDGQEEIFVSFLPMVNSMPLEEWFVLKQGESGWELLEMYHYGDDMLDNGFPITVTLQEEPYQLVVACEGCEKEIPFDATVHYTLKEKEKEFGDPSYDAYAQSGFKQGAIVGGTCAWGVWYIRLGLYEGESCLIAEHGLQGPGGKYDFYGCADVYFNYDAEGKIHILDLTFQPDVTEAPGEENVCLEPLMADTEIDRDATVIPLPMNATVSVDLDGDAQEELVKATISGEDTMGDSVPTVRVNDFVFGEEYMEQEVKLFMDNPDVATWYLFDIDRNDGYREIGLYEDGPSGDPYTTLLRYQDGELHKIGGFSDKPIEEWSVYHAASDTDYQTYVDGIERSQIRIKVPGDGTVYAQLRLDILETKCVEGLWKLVNAESFEAASLELQQREMYEFYGYGEDRGEFTPTVCERMQVYMEPDFEAEIVTLEQGENLDIYRYYPTDERSGWVQLAYHDRECFGWIFVDGYFRILQMEQDGKAVYKEAWDLIVKLSMVD